MQFGRNPFALSFLRRDQLARERLLQCLRAPPLGFEGGVCNTIFASNEIQTISQALTVNLIQPTEKLGIRSPENGRTLTFPAGRTTTYPLVATGATLTAPVSFAAGGATPAWLKLVDNHNNTGTISGTPSYANAGETDSFSVVAPWCCNYSLGTGATYTLKVTAPPVYALLSAPLAFLAGTFSNPDAGAPVLTSNQKTGSITLETALPFGLGATPTLCIENCTTGLYINGTPAAGTGGSYNIPFNITGEDGTAVDTFNLVVYETPHIVNNDVIVFNLGTPASAVINTAGFPRGPIAGSAGTYVEVASLLPQGVTFTDGVNGQPNGIGTLSYSGAGSTPVFSTVNVKTKIITGEIPGVTGFSKSMQLHDEKTLSMYIGPAGDVNMDGKVNCADMTAVKNAFGKVLGQPGYSSALDVNHDDVINIKDLAFVAEHLPAGTVCQ